MTYTLRESRNSKNFTRASDVPFVFGMPRVIEAITIHHWGSLGQRFEDVENFLCTNNTPTSAHYVVQAGLVSCIVTPDDAAWHSGSPRGNAKTVGLELRPEATDADYQTAAELVRDIRKWAGDIPLLPHNHWFNTACPGKWDLARLDRMARAAAAPAPVIKPASSTPAKTSKPAPKPAAKPAKTNYVADPHWVVEPGETLGQVAAHYGVTVDAIAKYNGIKNVNSIKVGEWVWPPVGRDTWTVDPGDTLAKIAKFYGVPVDRICFANGINDPSKLTVGRRLQIPK